MATKSILKNITIRNKRECSEFVKALENAKRKKSIQPTYTKAHVYVKGENIKDYFGVDK